MAATYLPPAWRPKIRSAAGGKWVATVDGTPVMDPATYSKAATFARKLKSFLITWIGHDRDTGSTLLSVLAAMLVAQQHPEEGFRPTNGPIP